MVCIGCISHCLCCSGCVSNENAGHQISVYAFFPPHARCSSFVSKIIHNVVLFTACDACCSIYVIGWEPMFFSSFHIVFVLLNVPSVCGLGRATCGSRVKTAHCLVFLLHVELKFILIL